MLSIFNRDSSKKQEENRAHQDFWWWEEAISPSKTQRTSGSKDDFEIFRDYQRKALKRV